MLGFVSGLESVCVSVSLEDGLVYLVVFPLDSALGNSGPHGKRKEGLQLLGMDPELNYSSFKGHLEIMAIGLIQPCMHYLAFLLCAPCLVLSVSVCCLWAIIRVDRLVGGRL